LPELISLDGIEEISKDGDEWDVNKDEFNNVW